MARLLKHLKHVYHVWIGKLEHTWNMPKILAPTDYNNKLNNPFNNLGESANIRTCVLNYTIQKSKYR